MKTYFSSDFIRFHQISSDFIRCFYLWKHIKISLHWLVSPGHSAGIFASTGSTLYSFPGKGKTNEETSPCKRVAQDTFEKGNHQKTQLEKVGGDEPQRKGAKGH